MQNAPPAFREALRRDAQTQLGVIVKYLPLCAKLRDYDRAGRFYVRRLLQYLTSKLPLQSPERALLAASLTELLTSPGVQTQLRAEWAVTLAKLLARKRDLAGERLVIPWRPLYDLLPLPNESDLFFTTDRAFDVITRVGKLVKKARHFFAPGALSEIRALLEPQLCPSDVRMELANVLLTLFLPSNVSREWVDLLPRYLALVNSTWLRNNSFAVRLWLSVFARVAKHSLGTVDWNSYLPDLCTLFLHSLELSPVAGSNASPDTLLVNFRSLHPAHPIESSFAKLIVYTIRAGSDSQARLEHLLRTVDTFLHPSNTGSWSDRLARFVKQLGRHFAKRLGRERRGEVAEVPVDARLTDAHVDAFVAAVVPVAMKMLFAKSIAASRSAAVCLHNLAMLRPREALTPFLDAVYPALATVTETRRMTACMNALQRLAHPLLTPALFPAGAAHLELLLRATLPGIDPVDVLKTGATLAFYHTLFLAIPFVEAAPDAPVSPDGSPAELAEAHEAARGATRMFGEWSVDFLDRLLSVVRAREKHSKASMGDSISLAVLRKATQAFFRALSPQIFAQCARAVAATALNEEVENHKLLGALLCSATIARPREALQILLKPLLDQVLEEGDAALTQRSSERLANYVYLIGQTLRRGGREVLPYLPRIRRLLGLLAPLPLNDTSKLGKMGSKLLRLTLRALTEVYPLEYRALSPQAWRESEAAWMHWTSWGRAFELENGDRKGPHDLHIVWHEPSAEELAAARALVEERLSAPLRVLGLFASGASVAAGAGAFEGKGEPEASKGSGRERRVLQEAELLVVASKWLLETVRGTVSVLGDFQGPSVGLGGNQDKSNDEFDPTDAEDDVQHDPISLHELRERRAVSAAEQRFDGSRVPIVRVPPFFSEVLPSLTWPLSSSGGSGGVTLRTHLASVVTGAIRSAVRESVADPARTNVKLLALLSKLSHFLLSVFFAKETATEVMRRAAYRNRLFLRESYTGQKCLFRSLLVQQVELDVLTRLLTRASYSQTLTIEAHGLLRALQDLAVSDFAKVRLKACRSLQNALVHLPLAIAPAMARMVSVLRTPRKEHDEGVKGALAVLGHFVTWAARDWRRARSVFVGLLDGGHLHQDDAVQTEIHRFFTSAFWSLTAAPVSVPLLPPGAAAAAGAGAGVAAPEDRLAVTPEVIARRNASLAAYNESVSRNLRELREELVRKAEGMSEGNSHWRYQLMLLCVLHLAQQHSSEADEPQEARAARLEPGTLALLVRLVVGNHAHLRAVALASLVRLLHRSFAPWSRRHESAMLPAAEALPALSAVSMRPPARPSLALEAEWSRRGVFFDSTWSGHPGDTSSQPVHVTRYVESDDEAGATYAPLSARNALAPVQALMGEHAARLIEVLVHDHPMLAPQADNSRKGIGDEIVRLFKDKTVLQRTLRSRQPFESAAFTLSHVEFVEAAASFAPEQLVRAWTAEFARLAEDVQDREKQATAAELFAGLVRASCHWPLTRQRELRAALLAPLLRALQSTQPESLADFIDAIRVACTGVDPRRVAWLLTPLFEASMSVRLPDEGASGQEEPDAAAAAQLAVPSVQMKRLRAAAAAFRELGWRARGAARWLLEHLCGPSGSFLAHPYKQVREDVARLLVFATRAAPDGYSNVVRTVSAVLAETEAAAESKRDASPASPPSPSPSPSPSPPAIVHTVAEDAATRDKNALECALLWMQHTLWFGTELDQAELTRTLFPLVVRAVRHADKHIVQLQAHVADLAAWTLYLPDASAESVLDMAEALLSADSYKVRLEAVDFAAGLVPRHCFKLSDARIERLCRALIARLTDANVDVRSAAMRGLVGLLMALRPQHFEILRKALQRDFARAIKQPLALKSEQGEAQLAVRHSAVLGLGALVLTQPYEVPDWLPPVLSLLVRCASDPSPVKNTVHAIITDFRRTHQDEWEFFKERFSEDQLDALAATTVSASYIT